MIYAQHTDRVETSVAERSFCFPFCSTAKRNEGNSSVPWNRNLVKGGVCLFSSQLAFPRFDGEKRRVSLSLFLSLAARFLVTTFDRSLATREISFESSSNSGLADRGCSLAGRNRILTSGRFR